MSELNSPDELMCCDFLCPDCQSTCNIPDNYCSNCGLPLKSKDMLDNLNHYDPRYLPKRLRQK
jgi:predicted amidophosphoribosyltransferase